MPSATPAVGPMKTITLSVEAGTAPEVMDLTAQPFQLEFICGLGSRGLTAFERRLSGLAAGETALLKLSPGGMDAFFEHLILPPIIFPAQIEAFYLRTRVDRVAPADPREVVRGLATMGGCGDDCCGHH